MVLKGLKTPALDGSTFFCVLYTYYHAQHYSLFDLAWLCKVNLDTLRNEPNLMIPLVKKENIEVAFTNHGRKFLSG